ncbi:sulfotransferase family protein [Thioalkalivibrio sp.]|uniref:sulfotransferase family protein n=1 Tax=Thioalkalivibrio sp. TaxID=2093813 RepID=UPI003562138F
MKRVVKRVMPNWAKPYARRIINKYGEATWSKRGLPDFIIIGAQKSGTTSLYAYLSQHPQLFPSSTKEVHFFDGGLDPSVDTFKKGMPWYRAHFPLRKNMGANQRTFEASPLYIFNPLAPERIANVVPNVKIIALLRNPTERAISHFFHERRRGREPLAIDEALEKE